MDENDAAVDVAAARAASVPRHTSKAVITPAERAAIAAHECRSRTGASGCLFTLAPATLQAVRALVRKQELDERGRTEVLIFLLAGHERGRQDFSLLGLRVCRAAFEMVTSFSGEKIDRVLALQGGRRECLV